MGGFFPEIIAFFLNNESEWWLPAKMSLDKTFSASSFDLAVDHNHYPPCNLNMQHKCNN